MCDVILSNQVSKKQSKISRKQGQHTLSSQSSCRCVSMFQNHPKEAARSVLSHMLLTFPGGAGTLGRVSIKPVKTCSPDGGIKRCPNGTFIAFLVKSFIQKPWCACLHTSVALLPIRTLWDVKMLASLATILYWPGRTHRHSLQATGLDQERPARLLPFSWMDFLLSPPHLYPCYSFLGKHPLPINSV